MSKPKKNRIAAGAAPHVSVDEKKRARRIYDRLLRTYPDAHCELDYETPFELLAATILSAQCTDVRVNQVTPDLFRRAGTPEKMAAISQDELETLIRSTGFYRNKAQSLREASRRIVEVFGGEVPREMDDLLSLRGVARKTANVVLGNAFGRNEGVVVDTHVGRLARRMGLTEQDDPRKVERDLMALFPRPRWALLSHLFIWHGRRQCPARSPRCDGCPVSKDCRRIGVK